MDPLGTAALFLAVAGGAAGLARGGRAWAVAVSMLGWWAAVAVLAVRFATVDLRLAEVASLTRDEVPVALRIAGVWAGPAGSILVWFAVVLTMASVALRAGGEQRDGQSSGAVRSVAAASMLGGLAVHLIAQPFDRVAEPVLAGRGLNPVLEHPMMLIHPPLLYLAQALVLAAALLPRIPAARRWTAAAATVLTIATLLGAWWAHDELGWGGWWAWDPVENTALAPLLASLAALHATRSRVAQRWRVVAAVAVLAGIALTRSGLPESVHAFSSGIGMAVLFAAAALGGTVWLLRDARGSGRPSPAPPSRVGEAIDDPPLGPTRRERLASLVLGVGAGWALVVIGAAGVAAAVLGSQDPPAAIDGRLLGGLIAPVGVALAGGLVLWGFRRRQSWPSIVAHVGALVFAIGVLGSLATRSATATLQLGVPEQVGGSTVVVTGVQVVEDRADVVRLEATATVDGRRLTAAILDHPDMGRTRARPGRVVDPWGETELVVAVVRDDRVRVELRRHPGLLYVWAGGATVAVGLGGSVLQSRRRRLASSSASSDEEAPSLDGSRS